MELKSKSKTVFDFTINEKQRTFFYEVMSAVSGKSDNRYFFYGGAIRGGKTSVCITILILLARKFPGSRWHILRDSFTTLEETTIPSFEKFCPEGSVKYNRNRANYHVSFPNGSKIFFSSEALTNDPDLNWMLGLETNGIFLEQIEGLSEKLWDRSIERTGSWYIDPMPPGIILSTFNPTITWVKDKVYTPYSKGELKSPYYFCEALPTDNPLVTKDQWTGWKNMDDISYKRQVEGNWDAFAINNPFAYAFDEEKHVGFCEYDPLLPLTVSFDFNIQPITCVVAQHDEYSEEPKLNVLECLHIDEGNSERLCELVISKYGAFNPNYVITGDGTGHNRSSMTGGSITHYIVIKNTLKLISTQVKAPRRNISPRGLRVITNSALQHYKITINEESCSGLLFDLKYVEVDEKGNVDKKNRKNIKQRADFLDCFNYLCELCFRSIFVHLYTAIENETDGTE